MKKIINSNPLPLLNQKGFSLIELLIMLAIIGLLAAVASTKIFDISTNVRISSAINQITSDIALVKEMALAKHKTMSITYNKNADEYIIRQGSSIMNEYPGSNNGTITLSGGIFSGVDITQVNINGSNKITFDKWGNVLNNGTITLNDDYTISIDKLTGFTEVIN